MKIAHWKTARGFAPPVKLSIVMPVMVALLIGCERAEQSANSAGNHAPVSQPAAAQQPLGQVVEFAGFTLRANVSRSDVLPDAMAQEYDINPHPDLALLNLVILDKRSDRQPEPVSAEVSAQYQSLTGYSVAIDMRPVEASGYVSYIGTLDASGQRVFQLDIKALPEGTDQPLHMNFEVLLESFDPGDIE